MATYNLTIPVVMAEGNRFNLGITSTGITGMTWTFPAGTVLFGTSTPAETVVSQTPNVTMPAFTGNVLVSFDFNETSNVTIDRNSTTDNTLAFNLSVIQPIANYYVRLSNQNKITGNLSSVSAVTNTLNLGNCTQVQGNLSSVSGVTYFLSLGNCTQVTGNLSSVSGVTYYLSLFNCTQVTGNLSSVSGVTYWLDLGNCTQVTGPIPTYNTTIETRLDNTPGITKAHTEDWLRRANANLFRGAFDKKHANDPTISDKEAIRAIAQMQARGATVTVKTVTAGNYTPVETDCWVCKPVADYVGASDNNGGGYAGGGSYLATYGNFCNANGSALATNEAFTYPNFDYSSSGVYGFARGNTLPNGIICRCQLYHQGSGQTMLFYAVYKFDGGYSTITYHPTGDSNVVPVGTLDSAMQSLQAGDVLTVLAYGGALATPEKATTLQVAGQEAKIESGAYEITAMLDAKVAYEKRWRCVDENGQSVSVTDKDNRAVIKPGANLTAMVDDWQAANSTLTIEGLVFDGNRSGTYKSTYGLQGPSSSSNTLTLNAYNVDFVNNTSHGIFHSGYLAGYREFLTCSGNGGTGVFTAGTRTCGDFVDSVFCGNVGSGLRCLAAAELVNCVICANGAYGITGGTATNVTLINSTLANNVSGDIESSKTTLAYKVIGCVLASTAQIVAANDSVIALVGSYVAASISNAPAVNIARITVAPPFVGGSGDDRYMLDLDGATIDSYWDGLNAIAGAFGPKVVAGSGGTNYELISQIINKDNQMEITVGNPLNLPVILSMRNEDGSIPSESTSVAVQYQINGGSWVSDGTASAVYPVSNGDYRWYPDSTESGQLGVLRVRGVAVGCIDAYVTINIVPAAFDFATGTVNANVKSLDTDTVNQIENIVDNITANLLDSRSFTVEACGKIANNAYTIEGMIDTSGEKPKWSADSLFLAPVTDVSGLITSINAVSDTTINTLKVLRADKVFTNNKLLLKEEGTETVLVSKDLLDENGVAVTDVKTQFISEMVKTV